MEWLSYTLTALMSFIGGALMPFLLKWRQADTKALLEIIGDLRIRIQSLEKQIEKTNEEHLLCVKVQAELKGKVEVLMSVHGQYILDPNKTHEQNLPPQSQ